MIKIVAWVAGGFVLLTLGLALYVGFVVDPNAYKPEIAVLVEKQIGRKLSIDGELELTFFPWLGVRSENIALSNPPGFDDSNMLTVAQVEVRARLMPLFSKQFEADTIVLRDPVVHLIVDADGATNWRDLAGPPGGDATAEQPTDPGAAMAALAVQGVDLKGGKLIWEDRQSGTGLVIENIDLDVGEVLSQQPVDLSLGLSLGSEDLDQPIALNIRSQVTLNLVDSTLTLSQAEVQSGYGSEARLEALLGTFVYKFDESVASVQDVSVEGQYSGSEAGQTVGFELRTNLNADIQNGKVQASNTTLNIGYGEAGRAALEFETLDYDLEQGVLRSDTLSLTGNYTDAALEKPLTTELHARLAADLAGRTIELNEGLASATYGPDAGAEARFGSLRYDLAGAGVEFRGLDLTGAYADASVPQPLSFRLQADAVGLVEKLARLTAPKVHVEYGSLGNADIGVETVEYRFDSATLAADRARLTGTYAGPELAQPLVVDMVGDVNMDTGSMVAQLGRVTGTANYGTLGNANIAVESLEYLLQDAMLEVAGANVEGKYTDPELEHSVDVTFEGNLKVEVGQLIVELADARGSAEYGPIGKAGFRTGFLKFDQGRNLVDARILELEGSYEAHEIRGAFSELTADIAAQKLIAPGFDLQVDGVPVRGNLEVSHFLGDAIYIGDIQTGEFNPATVLERLGAGLSTRDPGVLASAALSMKFNGSLGNVRLDDVEVRLDETSLKGFVEVEKFSPPAYRFNLDVDKIDVDRYAPEGGDEHGEAGAAMVVLPVGLFRGLEANGKLSIGSLRASGVNATDIDISVESSEHELTVKPISAALYGGTLEGDMHFTEKEGVARLQIKQTMDQVQVGDLLADTGVSDRISGKGQLDLNIVAIEAGGEPRTKGEARFHFFDGAIKGLDLRRIYLQARRIYNERKGREEEVETDDSEEFRFTELKGTLDFDERTARNDDLDIKSPLFRINGRGQADLSANRLDYLLLATVVESAKGQGGEALAELRGITLPIRISGGLNAPVYSLDVATILKLALQRRVEKEVEEKLQEKLGDELQEKLGDELQKLFKLD